MKMHCFFTGAVIFFALSATAPSLARADVCKDVVTARGSEVDRGSPVYDRSGLRLPIKLGFFCRFKPSQINVRFWVHSPNGKLYNVRQMWYEAASINALPNVARPRETAARVTKVGDAWSSILYPEYSLLQQLSSSGAVKCTAASVQCLRFTRALQTAERSATMAPQHIAFVLGDVARGASLPTTGAVMDSAVTAVPDPPHAKTALSESAVLTLYVQHRAYTVANLSQSIIFSNQLEYKLGARIGSSVPRTHSSPAGFYDFQTFSGDYQGETLSLLQSSTQGRDFDFCPPVTITFKTPALPVTAVMHCTGHADMGYDVRATSMLGYFRLQPDVRLTLQGKLLVNGEIAVGTVEGDLTLADFVGSTGGMYGFFTDPAAGGAALIAYRQFAYYDANAFHFTLKASLHTTWGADPGTKTLYAFTGSARALAPEQDKWYVMQVRT